MSTEQRSSWHSSSEAFYLINNVPEMVSVLLFSDVESPAAIDGYPENNLTSPQAHFLTGFYLFCFVFLNPVLISIMTFSSKIS